MQQGMAPDPAASHAGAPPTDGPTPRRRSPSTAALFSFVWPGLGQAYLGRRARAAVFFIPSILLAGALASLLWGGFEMLVGRLFSPAVALFVLSVVLALGVWRLVAVVDAWRLAARRSPPPRRTRRVARLTLLFALVAAVVGTHAVPAWWAALIYRTSTQIFEPPQTGDGGPVAPSPTPNASGPAPSGPPATPGPVGSPEPTREPFEADGLINVLFIGIDHSIVRPQDHRLTDTILLASLDLERDHVDMVSVSRDIVRFPLYYGGTHEQKINQLMRSVEQDPTVSPDGPAQTLVNEVEFLLGVRIDAYASVDIPGFERLIDAVGGVDVFLEQPLDDPEYQFATDRIGFYLAAGDHHLDGATAVAYVRSRKGTGSNRERSLRQQQVLLSLRRQLSRPETLTRLPEVLDAAAATVRTDLPADQLPRMMELARASDRADVAQIFLGPDRYARVIPRDEHDDPYALALDMEAVADLSLDLWGDASYYADEAYRERLLGLSDPGA